MEALEQKIWYYLNWETIIIWVCWVMQMRKAKTMLSDKRTEFWTLRRVVPCCECDCETAVRWGSLLEVFRVYLVVRRKIKAVNLYIGGKCFANFLTFIWKVTLSCQIITVLSLAWLNSDRKGRSVFLKCFKLWLVPKCETTADLNRNFLFILCLWISNWNVSHSWDGGS